MVMTKSHRNYTVVFMLGVLVIMLVAMGAIFVSSAAAQDTTLQNNTTTVAQDYNFESNSALTTPVLQASNETDIKITVNDSVNGEDSTNTTVTIIQDDTPGEVPAELEGHVTAAQYSAVLGDDDKLKASNLSKAINKWANSGSVDGVDISASALSSLINFWATS